MPRQLSHSSWLSLLDDIKSYLSSENYVRIHQKSQRRKGFISYAWEPDEVKNKVLQSWLSTLRNDLKYAALIQGIFLDIFNMHGDLKDSMLTGLKTSEVIFFICNPRFKARLAEGSNCGFVQMTEQPTVDSIKALKLVYEHVYIRVRGSFDELYYKTSWGGPTNITPKVHQSLDEFDMVINSVKVHRRLSTEELQSITAITGHAHNNLAFEVHTVLQEAARRQAQGQEPLKIIAVLQTGDIASALPEQLADFPLIDFTQLANDAQQEGYYKRITGFRNSSGLIPYIQEIQEEDVGYTQILYRHYLSAVPKAPRLFGREKALARLNSLVITNPVSFIDGKSGVGLSALAQHFAALSYQQGEQRLAEHYPVVRYLDVKEQDFDELTKEIAQELEVSHESWWEELLALPVPWLMVLDGDVKWEPRLSGAKQRLLRVQTGTPTISPSYIMTLAPLGDEAKLQMVRYYLAGSNELKDEHTLIKKYVAVGSLYNALEYIRNSPWLNLALFLKYKLGPNQQQFKSVTRQAPMVITQANSTQSNIPEVGVVAKWPVLKAGLKKILTESPALGLNLNILAASADIDEAQKLNQDLSECGIEGIKLILLDKFAQSQALIAAEITKGVALIIIATPNLKEELKDTEFSNYLEQAIRENIAFDKVAPLVVHGNFSSAVPSFLGGYLVRFADKQSDYEKMLMALDNPLGIIPAFYKLDKDARYNSYWHNYLLTNLPDDIPRYVGRGELLVSMHNALEDKTDALAITTSGVTITSMGGVGKSTLALMYGHKYLQTNCYDFVRFLNAEGDVLKSSLATLAADLGIAFQGAKFDEILAQLQVRLAQIPRYLLILDNVTKHEDIKDYYAKLKTLPGQHILVTSRDSTDWGRAIALNVFSENEALEYLQKELNLTGFRLMLSMPLNENDIPHQVLFIYVQDNILNYAARNQDGQIERESLSDNELAENLVVKLKAIVSQQKSLNDYPKAEQELLVNFSKQIQLPVVAGRELAAELGYLPLALSAAVAVIKDKCAQGLAAEAAIAEYVSDLRAGTLDMIANPVMRSLNLSLPKISAAPDALKLARYCAFLSSEHINPQWFATEGLLDQEESRAAIEQEVTYLQSEENETNPTLTRAMQRVYPAVSVIVNFSLVTVKDYDLTMHRLMQEAVRMSINLAPEQLLDSYLLPLTKALLSLYPVDKTQLGAYDVIKLITPHMVCLEEHLEALAKKTLFLSSVPNASQARDKLLDCIADSYGYFGDYEAQKELLEKVRDIKKPLLAQDTAKEYLNTLIALSEVYGYLNCRAEQVRCLEETIDVCRIYRNFPNWENTYREVLEFLIKAYSFTQNHEAICTVLLEASEDINVSQLIIEVIKNFDLPVEQKNQLIPEFLAVIKGSEPTYVRCSALLALAALELPVEFAGQRLSTLVAAIKDVEDGVRCSALRALAGLKLPAELKSQVLPVLLATIKDSESDLRKAAIKVLAKLLPGELTCQVLPVLLAALKDSESIVREAAVKELAQLKFTSEFKAQIFPLLLAAIKDPKSDVRGEIIKVLAKLLPLELTGQVLPVLLAAIKDSESYIRKAAIEALSELELIPEFQDQRLSALLAAIKDSESNVRKAVIEGLIHLDLTPELKVQVLPVLLAALKDSESNVRRAAIIKLAWLNLTTELKVQVLPVLLDVAIKDSESDVRGSAMGVLMYLNLPPELVAGQVLPVVLLAASGDSDGNLRGVAFLMLALLKLTTELKVQVLRLLLAALKDSESYIRKAAIEALAALKLPREFEGQRLSGLLAAIKDSESDVRRAAIEVLDDLDLTPEFKVQVFPALLAAIKDSESDVRQAAVKALAVLDLTCELKVQVLPVLLLAASEDSDDFVRYHSTMVLAALKLPSEFEDQRLSILLAAIKEDSNFVDKRAVIVCLADLKLTPELEDQCLSALLSVIKDSESDVRRAAIEVLAKLLSPELAGQVLPILLAAIKDSEPDVRQAAVKALAVLDLTCELKVQVLPVLLAIIKDSDFYARARGDVIQVLATFLKLSTELIDQVLPVLLNVIKDSDSGVRTEVVKALAVLDLTPELKVRVLPILLSAIKDSEPNVRQAAVKALAVLDLASELKVQVLPVLLSAIKDSEPDVRQAAVKALAVLDLTSELKVQVLPVLLSAIKDSEPDVREAAIIVLSVLELTSELQFQAVSLLLAASEDSNFYVRKSAIKALAVLDLTPELKVQVLPVLLAALKDLEPHVRQAAIKALAVLELTDELKAQVLPVLLAALKDSDSYVRRATMEMLAELTLTLEPTVQIFPVLLAAIKDSDSYVRRGAIEVLAELKLTLELEVQAFPMLMAASGDINYYVRGAALKVLADLILTLELKAQVFPVLLAASEDANDYVIRIAVKGLAVLDLPPELLTGQALPVLLAAASEASNANVRYAAIEALAKLKLTPELKVQVLPVLLAASEASNAEVRYAAIEALTELKLIPELKVQVLPVLLLAASEASNAKIRYAAIEALAQLKLTHELTGQVLPALFATIKDDSDSDVRAMAIEVLAALKLPLEELADQRFSALLAATRDWDYEIKHSACKAITKLEIHGQQKEKIVKILQTDSRNIEFAVRVSAQETLANILAFDGNYQGQLELLKQALKIRNAIDGTKSDNYAKTLISMGECYINLKNIEEGLELLKQALSILKKTDGKRSKIYKSCLEQYEQAQKMLEQTSANIGQKDHTISTSSLPGLLADLQDVNATPLIKQTACLCLAELSLSQQQKEQVLPILMAASQGKEESVKDEASRVLVVFKYTPEQKANALLVARQAENEQYLPGLLGALEDDNPDIRYGACGSIAALDFSSIQKDRVLPALRALTQDKDENVKRIAIETVAMFEGALEQSRSATRTRR